MQIKILWIVLIVTNLAWLTAFAIVHRDRDTAIAERQMMQQQRDSCEDNVGKLTDTMKKLCACGAGHPESAAQKIKSSIGYSLLRKCSSKDVND